MKLRNISRILSETSFAALVNYLSDALERGLTVRDNLSCSIVEVEIGAAETITVRHGLGSVPVYRLVLRQRGGMITDGDWTDQTAEVINAGGKCSVAIAYLRG